MPTIVTLSELVSPSTAADILALELSVATQLNLPVTSWQPLDPSRTLLQTQANLYAVTSSEIAGVAQGGYASYAAVMLAGSSPFNDGAGFLTTWMDLRCTDQYNVSRVEPGAAAGPIPVQNTTAAAQTYVAGQLHFQHPTSGATYTNTAAGTVTGGGTALSPVTSTIQVIADPNFVGPAGSLSVGQTAIMLTPFPGVTTIAQTSSLVGTPIETNAHYLARCEAKLGTLSPNGAPSAYTFVAESLPQFGSSISPPSDIADFAASPVTSIATAATALLTALGFTNGTQLYTAPTPANPWGVTTPVTRCAATLNIGSGQVYVYAANAAGGVTGCAQLAITNVTWTTGVATVTTASAHGLGPGSFVIIGGVVGAAGVNNAVASTPAWQLVTASGSAFTFALASNPGTYTSGGTVEGGDLGMIDAAIQAQVVPIGQSALVQPATNVTINVTATAYIRTTAGISPSVALTNVTNALIQYFSQVPIGGVNAETNGVVPGSEILVTIANANPGTVSVQPTPGDTSLTVGQVPVLGTLTLTTFFV
jgi:hypothetical protein